MSGPASPANAPQPFSALVPDQLLDVLDRTGLRCDGRLQALNSFENRVYLVGLEDDTSIVAKFYRPGRWSDAQILEEHAFAAELADEGVPVVAPMPFADGTTLAQADGFRVTIYPRQGGRAPELDNVRDGPALRERIGQFIAQMHRVGERRPFATRPSVDVASYVSEPIEIVLASGLLAPELEQAWTTIARSCADRVQTLFDGRIGRTTTLRLHGDCHPGNLLCTDGGVHFVDLDDCRSGPAIQDLWMLADAGAGVAGTVIDAREEMQQILRGYERVREFDDRELALVEPLRTMRMLHYCAWLVQRRDDPAFASAFPWFGSVKYWQDQVLYLREQMGALTTCAFD